MEGEGRRKGRGEGGGERADSLLPALQLRKEGPVHFMLNSRIFRNSEGPLDYLVQKRG